MTRIGERPMRDRHGAHRKRGHGSDQLDLFAQAESSGPEEHADMVRASGPDTPEGDRADGPADAGPRGRPPGNGSGSS